MGTHKLYGQVPQSDVIDLVTDLGSKATASHNHDSAYSALGHDHAAAEGANAARFLSRLNANLDNVNWLIVGDSTGNETTEWVHLAAQALAAQFPAYSVVYHLWDAAGGAAYSAPTTIQTGSGSNTLHVWNCSVSGSAATYTRGSRWSAAVLATTPDYICVSYGHNEGTTAGGATAETWRTQMAALTESLTEACPLAALAIVLQNPRGDGVPDQQRKARVYREIAAVRGYGVIDVQSVFLAQPSLTPLLLGDNVHPSTTGSQLWAAEVARVLTYDAESRPRDQSPSLFATPAKNLILNGDFDQFLSPPTLTGWTASNCSPAKDTRAGWVETPNGYSVRLQASSAAQTYMHQDVPAGLLDTVKGKYVTLLARVRVASGQATTAGRVQISDSAGNISSTGSADLRDGWHWIAVTRLIDASATYVRARIYADSGTSASADISVASVHLVLGAMPRTADRPDVLTAADVGLGNVNNTSDANKPISTATQAALDGKQAADTQLTALAALSPTADQYPYFTSASAAALGTVTSFARGLLDDADAPAARATLGVAYGTAAGTVTQGDDARLSDSRTPTAHASTHASGGSDPVTPAAIGAATSSHNHDASYAASSHSHAAGDVTSGTLAIARVPTGTSGTTVALGDHTHSAAVVPIAPVALTDAATIAVDASLGNHFRVTLGGNRTLGAPTNPTNGQKILIEVKQDGTGSRTLAYNAAYRFGTDVTSPTLTTTASKTDFLGFVYNSTAAKWDCIAVSKGY